MAANIGEGLIEVGGSNRENYFSIAGLALLGSGAISVSRFSGEERHSQQRGAGFDRPGLVSAEWVSPPISVEENGDGTILTAVGVVLERRDSMRREALLGFFIMDNVHKPDSGDTRSADFELMSQSGPWLRTYTIDGLLACHRGHQGNDVLQDELNRIGDGLLGGRLLGGPYIKLAKKRINDFRNSFDSLVMPSVPAELSRLQRLEIA